jgi:hypothetical protein
MARRFTEPKSISVRLTAEDRDRLAFVQEMLTRMTKRASTESDALRYCLAATFENES